MHSSRQQHSQMMADSVFPDGTDVAGIEAAAVVRGSNPDRPGFDSILRKGPVLKPPPFSIDVQGTRNSEAHCYLRPNRSLTMLRKNIQDGNVLKNDALEKPGF